MACETCGGTQLFRKSNVVFEVNFGAGGAVMSMSSAQRWLRCTLDICGQCGRTTTYVQNPQQWLQAVGFDAVYDTSGASQPQDSSAPPAEGG